MDPLWKTALWQQFGATIDMLENALKEPLIGLPGRKPVMEVSKQWLQVYEKNICVVFLVVQRFLRF